MMPIFYVTKYALSSGVFAIEAKEPRDNVLSVPGAYGAYYYREGLDWHRTPEAAVARAEEMRVSKLASLRKQITRLEKLNLAKVKPVAANPLSTPAGEG